VVPVFSRELVSFRLQSNVPEGWQLISQGNGSSRNDEGYATWDSAGPVDEVYLVGGPLVKYAEAAGNTAAEVYLRGSQGTVSNVPAQKQVDVSF
ncbi:MAG: hypothetical protein QNK24_16220, partial [Desulfuromusa sp.]|nr:hypothetical protein [Desulfuromusa sp.]